MVSGVFYRAEDARGGVTKQGEDERRKGETGERDRRDGAAGLSPESESERPGSPGRECAVRVRSPGHERSRGTRGWEGVRAFTVFASTRCTFPRRRSEGARFRERKNTILERLAGTTAASDEEMRGFVRADTPCEILYSVQSRDMVWGGYATLHCLFSFMAARGKRYEN